MFYRRRKIRTHGFTVLEPVREDIVTTVKVAYERYFMLKNRVCDRYITSIEFPYTYRPHHNSSNLFFLMTEYIQAGMLELIYMIDLGIYHYNFTYETNVSEQASAHESNCLCMIDKLRDRKYTFWIICLCSSFILSAVSLCYFADMPRM